MYYIFRTRTALDGTTTKSVYQLSNYPDALKQFYATLSGDIGSELKSNLCMIISETGNVVDTRFFNHEVTCDE